MIAQFGTPKWHNDMDPPAHEETYRSFLKYSIITIVVTAVILLGMLIFLV